MNDIFTIEEINLICMYSSNDRIKVIEGLAEALPEIDWDQEMLELVCGTINKIVEMTDDEFAELNLIGDYLEEEPDEIWD